LKNQFKTYWICLKYEENFFMHCDWKNKTLGSFRNVFCIKAHITSIWKAGNLYKKTKFRYHWDEEAVIEKEKKEEEEGMLNDPKTNFQKKTSQFNDK